MDSEELMRGARAKKIRRLAWRLRRVKNETPGDWAARQERFYSSLKRDWNARASAPRRIKALVVPTRKGEW